MFKKTIAAILAVLLLLSALPCSASAVMLSPFTTDHTLYLTRAYTDMQGNPISSVDAGSYFMFNISCFGNIIDIEHGIVTITLVYWADPAKMTFVNCLDSELILHSGKDSVYNCNLNGYFIYVWVNIYGFCTHAADPVTYEDVITCHDSGPICSVICRAETSLTEQDLQGIRLIPSYTHADNPNHITNTEFFGRHSEWKFAEAPGILVPFQKAFFPDNQSKDSFKDYFGEVYLVAPDGTLTATMDYTVEFPDKYIDGMNIFTIRCGDRSVQFMLFREHLSFEKVVVVGNSSRILGPYHSGDTLNLYGLICIVAYVYRNDHRYNILDLNRLRTSNGFVTGPLTVREHDRQQLYIDIDGPRYYLGHLSVAPRSVALPALETVFAEDGKVHRLALSDTADYTVSGVTEASDAGSYTALLSLRDPVETCWEDGSSEDRSIEWKVRGSFRLLEVERPVKPTGSTRVVLRVPGSEEPTVCTILLSGYSRNGQLLACSSCTVTAAPGQQLVSLELPGSPALIRAYVLGSDRSPLCTPLLFTDAG